MELISIEIENFRAYEEATRIEFQDLTAIIGKNDVGKSTLLEALEIFFNNGAVKIDGGDPSIGSGSKSVKITVEFSNLPNSIVLDANSETSLAEEYLLTENGTLKIQKIFDCSRSKPSYETFVVALHPTSPGVDKLLELKERELQALVKERGLDVALKGNPEMRKALWENEQELNLSQVALPVSKPREDSKRIWEQIERHLPLFALFQSDRPSQDSDSEIQNPLKGAITAALAEAEADIAKIQQKVQEKSEEIAALTHEALKELDPKLANQLVPKFTPPTTAKWAGLFNIGMHTDQGIPLNKRGSGVRRLILVSFFKAEAERKLRATEKKSIIYAIEEPETSQHPSNQKLLLESFQELANATDCQVIITTHSPGLAAYLPTQSLVYVSEGNDSQTPSVQIGADVFAEVADALGVIPDNRVKVLICVEGPFDVVALSGLSEVLHAADPSIPCLVTEDRCAFITLGGSTLKYWVNSNYLKGLQRPEVHIFDSDVEEYRAQVAQVNAREDGNGSWAMQTNKHEIECYLHPEAISAMFDVEINVVDHPDENNPAVPRAFAEAYSAYKNFDGVMKDNTAKRYLSRVFKNMTVEQLRERDPDGEVEGWLRRIGEML